jgi:hypothetical protein
LLKEGRSQAVRAHTIDLAASTRECFFEDLHHEDKMTVTYQVAGGGHLDIDFWVTNPRNEPMYQQSKKDTGTYAFTADVEWAALHSVRKWLMALVSGRYTYCFSNEFSTVTGKTVSFNVHGVMYVEDDGKLIAGRLRQLA